MSFGRQNITTDLGLESSSISDFQKRLEPLPVISPSRELPLLATIRVHEGVTIGGRIMQAQGILKPIELVKKKRGDRTPSPGISRTQRAYRGTRKAASRSIEDRGTKGKRACAGAAD